MGFKDATQIASKAEKIFGVGAESSFTIQKQGYMFKKPFGKGGKNGKWQRRYFVLKDSFLFWYAKQPSTPFSVHPKGCLPLGGCGVFPYGVAASEFCFEVTHEDFRGCRLLLKTETKEEADDWMRLLSECRTATWENAILGSATLDKLKYAGTAMEKRLEREVEQAKQHVQEQERGAEEKERKFQVTALREQRTRQELLEKQRIADEMKSQLQKKEQQLQSDAEARIAAERKREEAERRLSSALDAIKGLEEAIARADAKDNTSSAKSMFTEKQREEIRENAKIIRAFFDAPTLEETEPNPIVTKQTSPVQAPRATGSGTGNRASSTKSKRLSSSDKPDNKQASPKRTSSKSSKEETRSSSRLTLFRRSTKSSTTNTKLSSENPLATKTQDEPQETEHEFAVLEDQLATSKKPRSDSKKKHQSRTLSLDLSLLMDV